MPQRGAQRLAGADGHKPRMAEALVECFDGLAIRDESRCNDHTRAVSPNQPYGSWGLFSDREEGGEFPDAQIILPGDSKRSNPGRPVEKILHDGGTAISCVGLEEVEGSCTSDSVKITW